MTALRLSPLPLIPLTLPFPLVIMVDAGELAALEKEHRYWVRLLASYGSAILVLVVAMWVVYYQNRPEFLERYSGTIALVISMGTWVILYKKKIAQQALAKATAEKKREEEAEAQKKLQAEQVPTGEDTAKRGAATVKKQRRLRPRK